MKPAENLEGAAAHGFDPQRRQARFERKKWEVEYLAVTTDDDGLERQRLRIRNAAKQR